ncbi:MAG: amidase family protein, partial [Gammaproteobacteria bacterium]|nr:amidase family protein [Gammaproteobacteria bacterium]
MATTAGAIALQNNHADNAFIADRLLERGAVILGKANLSEWAYFFCDDCPSGYSAMGGQTLNPYGRFEFGTGGSSSGSGASTAANYATVAVGSETSGSILSPSSANSLVGLKPTTGSISRTGVVPISATLDTTGPMTRSVQDAVILFNAMAGYDEADTAMPLISVDMQLIYRDEGLAGKRLGAMEQYAENEFYQHALSLFSQNEAVIVELSFEAERQARFGEFLGVEMVRDLALYLEQHAADEVLIDSIASLKAFNEQDMDVRAPYGQAEVDRMDELLYTSMQIEELRAELQDSARSQLDRLFAESNIDVLLSINNFQAGIAALANYPALTIPMGYQEDGRPIGLTLIAPSFQEQILIDVGAEFERLTQARRTPEFYQ